MTVSEEESGPVEFPPSGRAPEEYAGIARDCALIGG